ncbi:MAG: tetratricopeptide repeat protein [Armatimonadota bacterium]
MKVIRIGRTAKALIAAVVLCALTCSASPAQPQIPAQSLEKLQDLFGMLRDRLWVIDDVFWHQGQFERCIATLRLIVAMDPYETEAYSNAAWLMQNQLRDDEAEAFLMEGLRNNPDVYDMYWELGYFYYMHERFAESIQNLEKAVQFEVPAFAWHLLAHAHEHAGDPGTALSIWFRQEADEPDNPVPRIQIERITSGGPAPIAPAMAHHAREQRLKEHQAPHDGLDQASE